MQWCGIAFIYFTSVADNFDGLPVCASVCGWTWPLTTSSEQLTLFVVFRASNKLPKVCVCVCAVECKFGLHNEHKVVAHIIHDDDHHDDDRELRMIC